ncbi:alpha/beta fold hydrolase [Kocuria rhizophila]|uniref:alpha/beta hydrolase n=1 Tax=Kocuria rhizophila TaxID=72000 RepID=UPI001ABDD02F|nr:alpha/beta fold hydrolase [Kocuria rhizophila]MBO4145292.1 alpha/beta fold hydrolase [Kocuria rhizophila]MDN3227016.1 alpha/beta fold hydrolase [Kocuria rhizophila]QTK30953.1 alpha/beta fold hydrolase [Kocuria rhizophila]
MAQAPHVIWNNDEADRTGTPLVVMFHGYGSHEGDLMALSASLPDGFTVASVRAPQRAGAGFQWFPLSSELVFTTDAVVAAAEPVVQWLRDESLQHTHVILLGFSQGMAIATTVARHAPDLVDAVVGLSGFVVPVADDDAQANFFHDDALREEPLRLFWGRDPEDPVIPPALVDRTAEWAQQHADATKVQYRGIGHGVSPQELSHVSEYLRALTD